MLDKPSYFYEKTEEGKYAVFSKVKLPPKFGMRPIVNWVKDCETMEEAEDVIHGLTYW